MTDAAYAEYERGFALDERGGHAAEAEAAYRRAIAGGSDAAWFHLGDLIWPQPGRLGEAAAAYRSAIDAEDDRLAGWAAFRLGALHYQRGDSVTARHLYALAMRHGPEVVTDGARLNLGRLLAFEGDRSGARPHLEAYIVAQWDVDIGDVPSLARAIVGMMSRPRIARAWRAWAGLVVRNRRRRVALLQSSATLTSGYRWWRRLTAPVRGICCGPTRTAAP